MIWYKNDRMSWRCDDYKEGYHAIVEPHKEQFKVSIYHNDVKKISFKDLEPVDAMNISVRYINKHIKDNTI